MVRSSVASLRERLAAKELAFEMVIIHPVHMKRTNLVLNGELLDEARRLSGEKTYSATVGRALEDFVRRAKAGRILELEHSGEWQGDLAEMRGDQGVSGRRRRGSR